MTNNQKIDKMYEGIQKIETYMATSELKQQQFRKELDAITAKVEKHEDTQARAYTFFAVIGVIFTAFINWIFKHL